MDVELTEIAPDHPAMARDIAPLIRALRPGLGQEDFEAFAAEAHRQGAVFTAAYEPGGRCLAASVHRVLATSRGRLLFVDDLVTDPAARSAGVGTRLLAALRERARAAGCVRVELDSGTANHGAHRFYHAQRMAVTAWHFAVDA